MRASIAAEQNPGRQLEALGECHRVSTDKISGRSRAKRTAVAELIDYIREDNTARVASIDRLGRDTRDLYNLVAEITGKGVSVELVNENITSSPLDSLMLGIIAAFAELERRANQRATGGVHCLGAKARGYEDVEQAKAMIDMGLPKTEVAKRFGVPRQTLYPALKRATANMGKTPLARRRPVRLR